MTMDVENETYNELKALCSPGNPSKILLILTAYQIQDPQEKNKLFNSPIFM